MIASQYREQLKHLLPPGALWLLDADSVLSKTLLAIADELARIGERGADLIEESDPRTADESLDQWEEMLGLPDTDILEIPSTTAERRLAITQALIKIGGASAAYFIGLAAACGYTVTVEDGFSADVLRAGFLAGARVYGTNYAHLWKVIVQPPAGDALSHAELEAVIGRVAPAHTFVIFEYL